MGNQENPPVVLSSKRMMHSTPLLITFKVPSHAHLLTSHSSALQQEDLFKYFYHTLNESCSKYIAISDSIAVF